MKEVAPSPLLASPHNIWTFRQNKLSLVTRDLRQLYGIREYEIYQILIARGVGKWFAVRRHLIHFKEMWRRQIGELQRLLSQPGHIKVTYGRHGTHGKEWLRGYLAAMEDCKEQVRALCHSPRWQVPDHDRLAKRWIRDFGE